MNEKINHDNILVVENSNNAGSTKGKHGGRASWKRWLILAVLFSIVIAVGSYLYTSKNTKKQDEIKSTQSLIEQTENLAFNGENDEALRILDAKIAATDSRALKASYLSNKATILSNMNRKDEALVAVREAYDFSPTPYRAAYIAKAAAESGDKATAIDYYGKAIEMAKKRTSFRVSDLKNYQQQIEELQK